MHIVYFCADRAAVTDGAKTTSIINNLVKDIDDSWYTKLESEVERARSTVPVVNRGNDGKFTFFHIVKILLIIYLHIIIMFLQAMAVGRQPPNTCGI